MTATRFATLAVLLLVGSGCNLDGALQHAGQPLVASSKATARATEVRPIETAGRDLFLDGRYGAVSVRCTRAGSFTLRLEKAARAPSQHEAAALLEQLRIEESTGFWTHKLRIRTRQPDDVEVRLFAEGPCDTPLRIETAHGSIEAEKIEDSLRVEEHEGTLYVRGAASVVKAQALSSLRIGLSRIGIDIALHAFPEDARLEVEIPRGSVGLTLPKEASATVDARTKSLAGITVQGLLFSNKRLGTSKRGTRLKAVLGQGSGLITLRARTGTIALYGV